jgi:nifR3 family TIM-barrel protein
MPTVRIGNVEIAHPFVQAALSGYSDLPMRRIARRHGASYTLNEVVLDKLVLLKGKEQRRILRPIEADDHPVAGQLMGANPEEFGPAARLLADTGYDVLDINFGCPVKKVLGRCRGGFLLSQPEVALEIVDRVLQAVGGDKPVTLKMRRGLDDSLESERNFFTILDGAFARGACAITVHGRTVEQRYVGPSRWEFLKRVKQHVGERTILGSGDLFSAEACVEMMATTGVDGVTIARGAIGNPWIFRECLALAAGLPLPDPPSVPDQRATVAAHFDECVKAYGVELAGKLMRKFGIKYSELHPAGKAARDAFIGMHTPSDFAAVLARWYDPHTDYGPPRRKEGPGELVAAGATCGD